MYLLLDTYYFSDIYGFEKAIKWKAFKLEEIQNYPILPVKINKIEVRKEPIRMIDISVKNQNFIANGVFVHNSSARFERIREGAKKDHFKKVAEYMKDLGVDADKIDTKGFGYYETLDGVDAADTANQRVQASVSAPIKKVLQENGQSRSFLQFLPLHLRRWP